MSQQRPAIPAHIKRLVLVEAGHRCAIPTCRATTTQLAHIVPWVEVLTHEKENLIALCPNCHTRYDNGEIDRKAMHIYKQKLVFLSERYSKFELRVLEHLRTAPLAVVPGFLMVQALLDDELVLADEEISGISFDNGHNEIITGTVRLSVQGKQFLDRWAATDSAGLTYEDV